MIKFAMPARMTASTPAVAQDRATGLLRVVADLETCSAMNNPAAQIGKN